MCAICNLGYFVRHAGEFPGEGDRLSFNAEDRGGGNYGGKPSYTIEGAAGAIARAGVVWGGGPGAVVTFAFRDTAPASMPDDTTGFSRFNATQIEQTLLALQSWSDVADITFQRVGAGYSNNASMLFSNYSEGSEGAAAFAYYPGNTAADAVNGDVWVNSSLAYNSAPAYLNYGRLTLTHEIGHALGLGHPGAYNAGEGSPTYADADYREDTRQFSLMSYWSENLTGAQFYGFDAAAPLLDDIAAIQLIYGANMATRTGNTTYGFNSNTGRDFYTLTNAGAEVIFAVWDAGGYDTLNFSGYSDNQIIDLRQGHFSSVGSLTNNVAIAQGAVIERAIGGSGNDVMYAAATPLAIAVADLIKTQGQVINSRGAAYSIDGAFGLQYDEDIISSSSVPHASVRAVGNGNYEWYSFSAAAGETVTIDIDDTIGIDTVVRIYDANGNPLAQNDDGPRDVGSSVRQDSFLSFTVPAGGVYYIVVGTYAGAGNGGFVAYDPIPAGATYTLNVSLSGADAPVSGYEGSRLDGGEGNDQLHGGLGGDILVGGLGDDTMTGGAGDDFYYVDSRSDTVVEIAGEGTDTVYTRVSFDGRAVHIENLRAQGNAAINLIGNDLNNAIIGNNAANIIKGQGGDDSMQGLGGNDTYYVDSRGDVVIEVAGGGVDTVFSTVSYDGRAAHVENITLLGATNANVVANDLNNTIIGNNAANVIKGQGGDDYMQGLGGGDTYYVDSRGDTVVEVSGGGVDTVFSTVSFDARFTHVENVTLLGGANANAVANDLNNTLVGNSATNIIIGYGGADYLTGGGGADVFRYTAASDSSYSNYDRIMDLGDDDFIDLRGVDADVNAAGNQSFTQVDAFNGQAGQMTLQWLASAGFTLMSMDLDGDGVADMRVVLYGNHESFDNFLGVVGGG
jgi:Ca2+-binding RTX toxin-like protein